VGKGSARAPRLVDIVWGDARHPKVTLVGKGVCFDSGGLDLKPESAMKLMKKDMAGAAHALALADAVMTAGWPVRLRVLVPAVENSPSGTAMRPLDVLATRKGLTVEVGNTDAEGRLILADALAEADAEKPELLIDWATLTGAARVALGLDIGALFANDDRLANDFLAAGAAMADPLWRLPLWQPYRREIESSVADLSNVSQAPYGGAIIAALFLQSFVSPGTRWAHIDMMAWNTASRPGRPEGAEAIGLRAAYRLLESRYGAVRS
jgi:leucyl aminopeptidase